MVLRIPDLSQDLAGFRLLRIAWFFAVAFVFLVGLIVAHLLDPSVQRTIAISDRNFLASAGESLMQELSLFPSAAPGLATAYAEVVVLAVASFFLSTHEEYAPPIYFLYAFSSSHNVFKLLRMVSQIIRWISHLNVVRKIGCRSDAPWTVFQQVSLRF